MENAILKEKLKDAMIKVYGNKCWITEETINDASKLSVYQINKPNRKNIIRWESMALISSNGIRQLLLLEKEHPTIYKKVLNLLIKQSETYAPPTEEYYKELKNLFNEKEAEEFCKIGIRKRIKSAMKEVYGNRCWIDESFPYTEGEELTLHHMFEERSGGRIEWNNIALLSENSHTYLNFLDRYYRNRYIELNGLLAEQNKTYAPPTSEYYDEINSIIRKANSEIDESLIKTKKLRYIFKKYDI